MTLESDPRYIAMLERIVDEAREMQDAGRLTDPKSRRELTMLEHQLRALQARAQATASPRNTAVIIQWSQETCALSRTTRLHTRQLRKELYRLRLITGSIAS